MKKIILTAIALIAPTMASAAPINWSFGGTCFFGCTGALTGTLTGDPANLAPPTFLSPVEVSAWSFSSNLGTFSAGPGTASGIGYVLGAGGSISAGSMTFDGPGFTGAFTLGALGEFIVEGVAQQRPFIFKAAGSYARVPEPASLALLGLGLAGLGLVRRKRST